jgi:hypothetical protein
MFVLHPVFRGNGFMMKKYVSPKLTELGSLYSATTMMATGGYADMMGMSMINE